MRRPEESLSRILSASQPVLLHFGRGSSGKTRWRYLLYGLQPVCVNAIQTQPSASAKTQGPNSSWDAELGQALWDHTAQVWGGAPTAPESLQSIPPQSLPRSAWAALLGSSSDTDFGNCQLCLCGCRQDVQPTTPPIPGLSRNVQTMVIIPIRSFKDFTSRIAEWIKSNNPQQHHHHWKLNGRTQHTKFLILSKGGPSVCACYKAPSVASKHFVTSKAFHPKWLPCNFQKHQLSSLPDVLKLLHGHF